jgi:predicted nucleotidyltransferase
VVHQLEHRGQSIDGEIAAFRRDRGDIARAARKTGLMRELAERLRDIPGVVAVTLGGSRATGTEREDSDWDFGLYYRGRISADDVRALGFEGQAVEPGEWGRLVNGGAALTVEGERVDLLYRDLEVVEHWRAEAEAGRYEVDRVEGYVAGMATYVLAGELAMAEVLAGELPRLAFPEPLRETAPPRWRASSSFSLGVAEAIAGRGDVATCVGLLAKAAIEAAQAALAERGEWALNEKGIARTAGLGRRAESILAAPGDRAFELGRSVELMRVALGL